MRHLVLAAGVLAINLATPARAGVCDQPPYGSKHPELTARLDDLAGPNAVRDLLHNTCLAKLMHDAKMRQALHQIGLSDELIDGNDVGYVAVKVLQALKECVHANQCR